MRKREYWQKDVWQRKNRRPLGEWLRQSVPPNEQSWKDQITASYISKVKCRRLELTEEPRQSLQEEVWGKGLPDDVFCSILAWLPLSSFFRLQCVCKKWKTMSQDRIFLDACARIPSRESSLFLKGADGSIQIYEPALNAWKSVPGSFFRPKAVEGRCSLVTAAGGRILFIRSSPTYSLMVYNPLNNTHQILPPMLDMSDLPSASEIHVLGMYEDPLSKYYQILVVDKRCNTVLDDSAGSEDDDDLEPIESQVYDSRTGEWTMIGSFDPSYKLRILNAALVSESLHCLTVAPQVSSSFYNPYVVDELAVYEIQSYDWEHDRLQVPTQDQPLVAPHILSIRGRQMLVAAVPVKETRNCLYPKWKCIILWALEKVDKLQDNWVKHMEIDLQEVNSSGFKVGLDSFVFLSEGNVIYFGSNKGESFGMINLHSHSWRLLPSFPDLGVEPRSTSPQRFQTFVSGPRFDLVA